jgi:hypothetical protein
MSHACIPHAVPVIVFLAAACAVADTRYVSPSGSPANDGSRRSPWDIESTLRGDRGVKPGDTVYLLGGTYRRRPKEQFDVKLTGEAGRPIIIRAAPGERATIDGGLAILQPSADLWIRDLEILVSEPQPEKPVGPGSHPQGFTRPWGGLNIHAGRRNKYISLVIHDCRQGVSWWLGDQDSELHGCVIFDNGWAATDRGHGHAIYTQNDAGLKTISNNILTGGHSYSLHAYGSERAFVNNYLVENNTVYNAGPLLIGGGRPSAGIRAIGNILHGSNMQLGYAAPHNDDCEVRNNLIVNGNLSVKNFRGPQVAQNRIYQQNETKPSGIECRIVPNKYDPDRAHVAVLNWEKRPTVQLDLRSFLKNGDPYRLMNPRDLFGKPVINGEYDGRAINLPCADEFAAFVLLRDREANSAQ